MKKLVMPFLLSAACLAWADEWVDVDRPLSGDRVVVNDQTYVLLSVPDFDALTNKISILAGIAHKTWDSQHRTEAGRVAWHGKKISTEVSTNGVGVLVKTIEYTDGYRYVEESKVRTDSHVKPVPSAKPARPEEIDDSRLPARLRAARKGVRIDREVK